MGVLFRNGVALQGLGQAQVVAFDKTGTLTKGRPEVTDVILTEDLDRATLLRRVAAIERDAEHPIGRAIVAFSDALSPTHPPLAARNVQALPGFGVSGLVDGNRLDLGAARYLTRLGIDLGELGSEAERLAEAGKSLVWVAIDGRAVALIGVADALKETTLGALHALRRQGVKLAMITGDDRRAAHAIARTLGIETVLAEVLPDGKAAAVQALQASGQRVVFVGDGINDAPALASADVGVAIGSGTDIAIESADVVLMSGDLRNVPNAINLSRATLRNIHQNLFWAFAYNTLLIPVAAGVLYPTFGLLLSPILAAAAMGVSSVFVVSNALRLRRFQPPLRATVAAASGA
jgi:Cu+-exporting ATPase